MKKVIIAGPRDFTDKELVWKELDELLILYERPITEDIVIFEGGAKGVDCLAHEYALENDYSVKQFPADWSLGKKAGPIRNEQMAKEADVLIAFYNGSKGTTSMIKLAMQYGLRIHIIPIKK